MEFEINNDGCITVKHEISCIKATFSEDREDLIGVCRITGVEIECDSDLSYEIIQEVQDEIFNYFADKEYFAEDSNWQKKAEKDISNYTGVLNVDVDWE